MTTQYYYILIHNATNRTWAVSRRPFDPVPAHSRQERTNKSPLTIQHPAPDPEPEWTNKARQTVRASYSTRTHIMCAQQ